MVASKMDGRTLFDGRVPAGDEVVSALITELMVAKAIGGLGEDVKVREDKAGTRKGKRICSPRFRRHSPPSPR